MLDVERQYFADHLEDLLQQYPGRFVVVKAQRVVGDFDTPEAALREAARMFGLEPGASDSCIDNAAAHTMGLPVIDVVFMTSATHANEPCNVHPISIEVTGANINIEAPRALGANLAPPGLILLIGRNVLQHCNLIYNGIAGIVTLAA